jgi:urease accessory protein
MTTEAHRLLLLFNWMSPAFPTGQFAYSHGLEWAIAAGTVRSAHDVRDWMAQLLTKGSAWNDAVLFARCWEDDADGLNELALALCVSRERYLETTQLGMAFAAAAAPFLPPLPRVKSLMRSAGGKGEISYPIAAGTACAAMTIDRHQALLAFLQGFCAALTSVAVRLVPLGQTAGLQVLSDLMPAIALTAERAQSATLEDLGSITMLSDIAAMKHEDLEPRVFRS